MTFDPNQDPAQEPAQPPLNGVEEDTGDLDPMFVSGPSKPGNRNAFVLGGLAVVGVATVWFMFFRHGPASASAADSPQTNSEVKQFLDSGNINLMKQTLKNTEKIVQQFRAYPGKTQVPLADLRGNPFRELPSKPQDHGPLNPRDDEKEQREHAAVVKAVSGLHLQSVIRGGRHKACMINNTMYQEGQQIGPFTIAEISPQTVVLEAGKYRFELKMQE